MAVTRDALRAIRLNPKDIVGSIENGRAPFERKLRPNTPEVEPLEARLVKQVVTRAVSDLVGVVTDINAVALQRCQAVFDALGPENTVDNDDVELSAVRSASVILTSWMPIYPDSTNVSIPSAGEG